MFQVQLCRQTIGTKGQLFEKTTGRHHNENGNTRTWINARPKQGNQIVLFLYFIQYIIVYY